MLSSCGFVSRKVYPDKERRRSSVLDMMMNGGVVEVEGEGGREEEVAVEGMRRQKSLVVPEEKEGARSRS